MRRVLIWVLTWMLAAVLLAGPLRAQQRIIVRALGGEVTLNSACLLLGCKVIRGLDDPAAQLILITVSDTVNLVTFLTKLLTVPGILHVEVDLLATISEDRPPIPGSLYDSQLTPYYGADVRYGYVHQSAAQLIGIALAQGQFQVSGTGIVAVIDTGVDPDHPALRNVLLPGYDLTRNRSGSSEMGDVSQSTAAVVDGVPPIFVNSQTAAVVSQSTAAVVDDPGARAFGHGTMVAGLVHLAAPGATILPIKAFRAGGSGYTSDILRGIYRAVRDGARVINMSFSMPTPSVELKRAIDYAVNGNVICVASAGNQGQEATMYPAAWSNVIGVASTTDQDQRAAFSNYGANLVWVAAPGDGVITTYPYGTYAAAWGTSFSTPLVSGTAALLLDAKANLGPASAAGAIGHAVPLGAELGHGRLDIFGAVQAAVTMP